MTFPLYYLLYGYYAFLVLWGVIFFVAVYHMLRFSLKNFTSLLVCFVFIGVSAVIFLISFDYINAINWDIEVTILENIINSTKY